MNDIIIIVIYSNNIVTNAKKSLALVDLKIF